MLQLGLRVTKRNKFNSSSQSDYLRIMQSNIYTIYTTIKSNLIKVNFPCLFWNTQKSTTQGIYSTKIFFIWKKITLREYIFSRDVTIEFIDPEWQSLHSSQCITARSVYIIHLIVVLCAIDWHDDSFFFLLVFALLFCFCILLSFVNTYWYMIGSYFYYSNKM